MLLIWLIILCSSTNSDPLISRVRYCVALSPISVIGFRQFLGITVSFLRGCRCLRVYHSVLGPILFSLFINDLPAVLVHSRHLLYADDLQIYVQCTPSNLLSAINQLSADVEAVSDWAARNKFMLNLDKTKAICVASSRFLGQIDFASIGGIRCGNSIILFVQSVKTLGVTLSSNLSWSEHVNHLCSKVNMSLHQLRLHRELFGVQLRRQLVISLIFLVFDYCAAVYCDLSDELGVRLERSLNSCIRFIYDMRRDEHITSAQEGWLTIKKRRLYLMGSLFFSILSTGKPSYLFSFINFSSSEARITRVSRERIFVPLCRTEIYKQSFFVQMAYFWNNLPEELVLSASAAVFKRSLFRYLLDV